MLTKTYRGYWQFSPANEYITYEVKAQNKDCAWRLLAKWAYRHQNMVDSPLDFEIELVLSDTRAQVCKKIALGVAVLLATAGFALANYTDTMPMSKIIPQALLALVLWCVAFGIYRKMEDKYNV